MLRKLFLFYVSLAISLFVVSPVLAAKSYRAERFDVQVAMQENGAAIVTETVEFHFEGDPFTYAFREVAADNTDGVSFLDASLDGIPMQQGTLPGQVEVEAGDPLKVKWHFSATANAAHTFVVRYRVDGLVRKGEADTIIWRAIPEAHDYAIRRATVSLTYPAKATLLGNPTLSRSFVTDGPLTLIASDLAEDDDLVLTAHFAPGSLTQVMPEWQAHAQQMNASAPAGFVAGFLTLLLAGLALFSFARTHQRELNVGMVLPSPTPPSDLPPAVVGKLLGKGSVFMGTVFDLAQRGALEICEESGFLGSKRHRLIRKETNFLLSSYESSLLNAIFKAGETEMSLSEIGARVAGKASVLDMPVEAEMLQRGWRDSARNAIRAKLTVSGAVSMFAPMVLFVVAMFGISRTNDFIWMALFSALVGISVGSFISSMVLLVYASRFSVLTPAGEEQAVRWKGFEEYLKQVSKGKEPAIRPDYFERYLAYAAMFGLGASWAKYFQTLGGVPLPVWFRAAAGNNADFAAIVAVMSASDSTGAGAGAGGAGASGGGSSGAG